jgi:hypothetical protein
MCCYKTLSKNSNGYVVFCKNCEKLHVGFGNALLSYTIEDFYSFELMIRLRYEEHVDDDFPYLKTISVTTKYSGVTLVYSPDDLVKLLAILNKAKDKLTLEKLFVFNEN